MANISYRRDFPDGSCQYFLNGMEPDRTQRYFDDMLQTGLQSKEQSPLEFLFFGKEQSYPNRVLNRTTQNYILHYVTNGTGRFNGRRIRAGEGFLVVPGVEHRMESDGRDPWHFQWVCFRGFDAKAQMKQIGLDREHAYFSFCFSEQLEALFDAVIYREHRDVDVNTYMQGIFYILLSYHKKQYRKECCHGGSGSDYAMSAMQYIDAHFRENLRVGEVAKQLHISEKYLCAVLNRAIGMSTKEYLLKRRVSVASELLSHTSMSVEEIAREVGYGDYTQFSRMFRVQTGTSPQQFRRHGTGTDLTDE